LRAPRSRWVDLVMVEVGVIKISPKHHVARFTPKKASFGNRW
jgi:hypothetical protein